MVVNAWTPWIWEAETGGMVSLSFPWLYSEFKADYLAS